MNEYRKLNAQPQARRMTLLKATDFEREISSARILYLTGNPERRIVILENQAYRFMLMNGTIQSVMSLAQPQAIVFPHQQIMLQSLKQLPPASTVLELGLGGGSAVRHARLHDYDLSWINVEYNSEVVNLFWDYFNPPSTHTPERLRHSIELAEIQTYLAKLPLKQKFALILCDVDDELDDELLHLCVKHLSESGELVVNWLPHVQSQGEQSGDLFATLAKQAGLMHKVTLVPGFANQVHRLRRC